MSTIAKPKVAIVTGAASGIGAAIAEKLISTGYKVAAMDIKPASESDAADIYWKHEIDVSDALVVSKCVDEIAEVLGAVDVLVNAAGMAGSGSPLLEMQEAEIRRILDVNLVGPIMLSKAVLQTMVPRGKGSIVNIASVAGMEGAPRHLPYAVAKAGLINGTRTMAWEYSKFGIRINAICPGLIRTEMTAPLFQDAELSHQMTHWSAIGRAGTPNEVAAAAAFLASDEASFISGHCLVVDGGWTSGRDVIPARK